MTGEPCALKGASTVRRGTFGKGAVMRPRQAFTLHHHGSHRRGSFAAADGAGSGRNRDVSAACAPRRHKLDFLHRRKEFGRKLLRQRLYPKRKLGRNNRMALKQEAIGRR